MNTIKNMLKKVSGMVGCPTKHWVLCLMVVCLLAYLGYMVFNRYYGSAEFFSDKPKFYFFNVEWCGHCKTTKPKWEELVKNVDGVVNGKPVELVSVNAEDEANAGLVKQYNVQGYPTLVLQKGEEKVEYSGDRSTEDMHNFLKKNL